VLIFCYCRILQLLPWVPSKGCLTTTGSGAGPTWIVTRLCHAFVYYCISLCIVQLPNILLLLHATDIFGESSRLPKPPFFLGFCFCNGIIVNSNKRMQSPGNAWLLLKRISNSVHLKLLMYELASSLYWIGEKYMALFSNRHLLASYLA
jgi:hypothetical protein